MNVFIRFIIFLTISYTVCVCDYNFTVQFKKRHIKEIDVLRQLINQETLIRLSLAKEVRAAVGDVSYVKRGVMSTRRMASNLQQALNKLKRHVAALSQNDTLSQKMETLKKRMEILSQNNTLHQTVETLKKQVAILSEDDTLAQKLETMKKQIFSLYQNNTLQRTVEALKREIDFLKSDRTLVNSVESLKRGFKNQKQENRKKLENCENRLKEINKKITVLNGNITDIYYHLNRTEEQTLEKGLKLKKDCKDHYLLGHTQSGVYEINPFGNENKVLVYCDMVTDGGGWTAIQKRVSGSVSFKKTWAEYKKGFGNPRDSYWIGNEVIHTLTKGNKASLYVSITLTNGQTLNERYQQFSISDESDKYRLFIGGTATGTLGDTLRKPPGGSSAVLSGMYFSTPDRDNDNASARSYCAEHWGGGWWFNACHNAFLNGLWNSQEWPDPWEPRVTLGTSVKETMMMIKPH